jgi:hypothetical protein
MKEVYVCLKETPDEGRTAVGVYDNEESAREWIRQEFMKFKAEDPKNECSCNNENYCWGDGDILLGDLLGNANGYEWYCYYELESYGWYVVKLPVLK